MTSTLIYRSDNTNANRFILATRKVILGRFGSPTADIPLAMTISDKLDRQGTMELSREFAELEFLDDCFWIRSQSRSNTIILGQRVVENQFRVEYVFESSICVKIITCSGRSATLIIETTSTNVSITVNGFLMNGKVVPSNVYTFLLAPLDLRAVSTEYHGWIFWNSGRLVYHNGRSLTNLSNEDCTAFLRQQSDPALTRSSCDSCLLNFNKTNEHVNRVVIDVFDRVINVPYIKDDQSKFAACRTITVKVNDESTGLTRPNASLKNGKDIEINLRLLHVIHFASKVFATVLEDRYASPLSHLALSLVIELWRSKSSYIESRFLDGCKIIQTSDTSQKMFISMLSGVLAHELGHLLLGHTSIAFDTDLQMRGHEIQADVFAVLVLNSCDTKGEVDSLGYLLLLALQQRLYREQGSALEFRGDVVRNLSHQVIATHDSEYVKVILDFLGT